MYLGSLVSGISLSSGILSLRNWLKPFLVNPIFSSSFSSSVCGSKLFFHSCVGAAFCSTRYLWTLLSDVLVLLYAKNESKLQESAKHNNLTDLRSEHLTILKLIPLEAHARLLQAYTWLLHCTCYVCDVVNFVSNVRFLHVWEMISKAYGYGNAYKEVING